MSKNDHKYNQLKWIISNFCKNEKWRESFNKPIDLAICFEKKFKCEGHQDCIKFFNFNYWSTINHVVRRGYDANSIHPSSQHGGHLISWNLNQKHVKILYVDRGFFKSWKYSYSCKTSISVVLMKRIVAKFGEVK